VCVGLDSETVDERVTSSALLLLLPYLIVVVVSLSVGSSCQNQYFRQVVVKCVGIGECFLPVLVVIACAGPSAIGSRL